MDVTGIARNPMHISNALLSADSVYTKSGVHLAWHSAGQRQLGLRAGSQLPLRNVCIIGQICGWGWDCLQLRIRCDCPAQQTLQNMNYTWPGTAQVRGSCGFGWADSCP